MIVNGHAARETTAWVTGHARLIQPGYDRAEYPDPLPASTIDG